MINNRCLTVALVLLFMCVTATVFCEPAGDLQVTLLPSGAITAGAMWRVVGETTWHTSGESVVYGIDSTWPGPTIEFTPLVGWRSPQTRTITLVEDGTVSTTATYYPLSAIADSQADFSLTQGNKGWRYGYYSSGTTFTQFTQTQYNATFGNLWYGGAGYLWNTGGQPYNETHKTVRRWASTVSGHVVISGRMWKYTGSNGGNGFTGSVSIGGAEQCSRTIGGSDNTGVNYSFETQVTTGQNVDFMIDAILNTYLDNCGLTGNISTTTWTGSLKVTLGPEEAIAAGVKWRRVGTTAWFSSGETEYDVPVGSQTIEFSTPTGWTAPVSQAVTIADGQLCQTSATYPTGSLHVTIQPSGAIADGAQWRRVGTTAWFASDATETGVPVGNCSIEFSPTASLATPATQSFVVAADQTSEATGTYVQGELLKVNILPALAISHKAQWRRVGTTIWRSSGDSDRAPLGNCAIEFKKIPGWHEPVTSMVAISQGNPIEQTRTYRGGTIVAWRNNVDLTSNVPAPNDEYVAIAAGYDASIALRSDGSVATWGTNPTLPSPNSGFVAVSAGYQYFLGLRSDGSVAAWGLNDQGQCNVPAPNTGFVAIAGGEGGHAIGLKNDGTVVGWGSNVGGVCNTQYSSSGFLSIATGIGHSMALLPNGSIIGWGENDLGQLNVPAPNSDFVSIACGNYCSIGVRSNGTIAAWGANDFNQVSPLPSPNAGFVAASANLSVVGLKSDGSVIQWGYAVDSPSPNTGFAAVAAGMDRNLALKLHDIGNLRVTIQPTGANAAGARWRRVGTSPWLSSGETECDLPVGGYSVEFADAGGWTKPGTQAATIAPNQTCEVVGTYLAPGSLHVVIQPATAVTDGAGWRRVGTTTWLASGETEPNIPVGNYTVEFSPIVTLGTPATQQATVVSSEICELTGIYAPGGTLSVNISPALAVVHQAQWRRVGSTDWHNSGDTENLAPGSHSIEFKQIVGWCRPTTRTVTVAQGGTSVTTGAYRGGVIVSWGMNDYGQCNSPSPNADFVSVASYMRFTVGLRSDGSIGQWGQLVGNLPYPNTGFVAVSNGWLHALGLKSDGSIVAWGNNEKSQLNVPSPNSGFVAICCGDSHSVALRSDGSIAAWGDNSRGQCNLPSPNSGFVSVAAGDFHSLAARADGSVVAWGSSNDGQTYVPWPNSGFVSVASGDYHSLGMRSDGSVVGWGYNIDGQCNAPSPNSGFVSVDGSRYHTVGLRAEGSMAIWGGDALELLNIPSPNSGFVAVNTGFWTVHAIRSTDVGALHVSIAPAEAIAAGARWRRIGTSIWYESGETEYEVPTGAANIEFSSPVGWSNPADQAITIMANQTCEATGTYQVSGSLYVTIQPSQAIAEGAKWRRVGTTQWLAGGETEQDVHVGSVQVEFSQITSLARPTAQAATVVSAQTSEVTGTYVPGGTLKVNILPTLSVADKAQWRRVGTTAWHDNGDSELVPPGLYGIEFKQLGRWSEPVTRILTVAAGRTTETTGTYHGGAAVAWGRNDRGQCNVPTPNTEFVAVAGGIYYSVGLKSDGSVVQWGFPEGSVPFPNSGFVAVSCGDLHAMGLRSDGSVTCWGYNPDGRCSVPSPNSGFVAIDAGSSHSMGLKSDGSVVIWGDNTYGKCNIPSPNSGFTGIAAGGVQSLAIMADSSVIGWGFNSNGECVAPSPNSGFVSISSAEQYALGLKSDGSIVYWGYIWLGQDNVPSPNSGFISVDCSKSNAVAQRSDGSIAIWGNNYYGQCDVPAPNSRFIAAAAGYNTRAVREADFGSLRVTTTPADGRRRRVGTSQWYGSGETEYDITPGSYTVEFCDLAGWTKPSAITVTTNTGPTEASATYTMASATVTLSHVKSYPDGTAIRVAAATVSAAWPDVFYVETSDRASGIRVEKTAHGLVCGDLVDLVGTLGTNASGERFIQASTATKTGDGGAISPLGMTNRNVGGASLLDSITGFGQIGVLNGSGLNNIGLLVRTSGRVVEIEPVTSPTLPTWFKIDDGSGARIKCIVSSGVLINAGWSHVSVTGVSSCEKVGADIIRLIRIRTTDDVVPN